MTTIAYRDGIMAADSQVMMGNSISGTTVKVRKVAGYLFGIAGQTRVTDKIEVWFRAGMPEDKLPNFGPSPDFGMLAADTNGTIFVATDAMVLVPITAEYAAIGSGREFALGAMAMGATAAEAVAAASQHDPYSGGAIATVRIDQHEHKNLTFLYPFDPPGVL